jgi:hypothetical protein
MNRFELGRLLRLRGAIDSIAGKEKLEPSDAASLTDGYRRMRGQVAELVAGAAVEPEFEAMFPEMEPFVETPPGGPGLIEWHHAATSAATQAQVLLDQLSGWVDGLIAEQTMPERIQAEAAERVRREQPGFDGV